MVLKAQVVLIRYNNCTTVVLYSALIWQSFILVIIGDLKSKSPLLKHPIINVHAHNNARVHKIAKLKTANYIFMGKLPIKALYSIFKDVPYLSVLQEKTVWHSLAYQTGH